MSIAAEVQHTLKNILSRRCDVTVLATRQRSKFEHWLKFELAAALSTKPGIQRLTLEDAFPQGGGRCDLSLETNEGKWYVELKTSNTNWRVQGVENKTRPITKNVSGIISDIEKLRARCLPAKGIAAFVLFPIPTRIWDHERSKLLYHLRRIEDEAKIVKGVLSDSAEFIQLDSEFGIALFVVEVVVV